MKVLLLVTAFFCSILSISASVGGHESRSIAFVGDTSLQQFFSDLKTEIWKYAYEPDMFRKLGFNHYILVTFSNKLSQSKGHESFSLLNFHSVVEKQVSELQPTKVPRDANTTRCADYGVDGLWKAVNLSLPYSYIFYFTDGSVKDAYNVDKVILAALSKKIRIWVIATDCCNVACSRYVPYMKITKWTAGVFYTIDKKDINTVLNFIDLSIKCQLRENLDYPARNFARVHYWVDNFKGCPPAPSKAPITTPRSRPPELPTTDIPKRPSTAQRLSTSIFSSILPIMTLVISNKQ